tara:strand:+ start:154 stop:711 length:558 start_codon:yes stop_codon:yes gene_type:complete
MNYILAFALIVVVILLTTNMESFTETFGLSGYTKPVPPVKLNDPRPNLEGFEEFEVSVDNDIVEKFTLKANQELSKRTGMCTYIIETTAIKGYRKENVEIYDVMYMAVKKDGFSFGFSVVASFEVQGSNVNLVALRSQPLGVQAPGDVSAFARGAAGKEFVKYELVKEAAVPTKSEFDSAKNKLE